MVKEVNEVKKETSRREKNRDEHRAETGTNGRHENIKIEDEKKRLH